MITTLHNKTDGKVKNQATKQGVTECALPKAQQMPEQKEECVGSAKTGLNTYLRLTSGGNGLH